MNGLFSLLKRRTSWVLALAAIAIASWIVWHYRYHLQRQLTPGHAGLTGSAVPAMPTEQVPTEWSHCQLLGMHFALPAELAGAIDRKATQQAHRFGKRLACVFKSGARTVMVVVDRPDSNDKGDFWQLPADRQSLTQPQIQLAIIRADSRDFRWSMSPRDARWHLWLMRRKRADQMLGVGNLVPRHEVLANGRLTGLLSYYSDGGSIHLGWATDDGKFSGGILMSDRNNPPDESWMRGVCQSVVVDAAAFPAKWPEQADEGLLQVSEGKTNSTDNAGQPGESSSH